MQLLLDKSLEFETTRGLSLISGDVIRIDDNGLTGPNIDGSLKINDSPLLNNFKKGIMFLFCT